MADVLCRHLVIIGPIIIFDVMALNTPLAWLEIETPGVDDTEIALIVCAGTSSVKRMKQVSLKNVIHVY